MRATIGSHGAHAHEVPAEGGRSICGRQPRSHQWWDFCLEGIEAPPCRSCERVKQSRLRRMKHPPEGYHLNLDQEQGH